MDKNKQIEKEYFFHDEKSMTIKFYSKNIQNAEKKELERLLDNNFKDKKIPSQTFNLVCGIKTIFRNHEKDYLEISIKDKKSFTNMTYLNSKLIKYSYHTQIISLNYEDEQELSFKTKNCNLDNELYGNIFGIMNHIQNLKQAKTITNNGDGEIISYIYNLFYNKYPDFSLEDTKIKTQAMMAILDAYGISLGDKYYFCLDRSFGYTGNNVLSHSLKLLLEILSYYGEIKKQLKK